MGLSPQTGLALSSPCSQNRDLSSALRPEPQAASERGEAGALSATCNAHVRLCSCPRCDSTEQLRALLPGLEQELKDAVKFKALYQFTFAFARSPGQKGLGEYTCQMPGSSRGHRRGQQGSGRAPPLGSPLRAPLAAGTVPRAPAPQPAVTPDVWSQKYDFKCGVIFRCSAFSPVDV